MSSESSKPAGAAAAGTGAARQPSGQAAAARDHSAASLPGDTRLTVHSDPEQARREVQRIDHDAGFSPQTGPEPETSMASRDDIAVRVQGLTKCFQLYDNPGQLLKQQLVSRLSRLVGRQPPQYFREYWALKGIDFSIRRGEVVGIVGRNGAGKSTLLQILCGTLSPTEGTVDIRGRVAALLELGAGFNPEFSGRENVYLNGAILGISREEITRRFDDIAAFADIGEFIERPVKSYSSGMYVRLAFAVSACVEPDVLIVDEALAVGDAKFQAKCFRRFEELVARGTTILLVTHSIEQITRHCDRAILLEGGVVHQEGPPKDVANTYLDLLFGVARKPDTLPGSTPGDASGTTAQDLASSGADATGTGAETAGAAVRGQHASAQPVTGASAHADPSIHPDYSPLARRVITRPAGRFEERAGYNSDEFRWGSREVEISDFMVTTNGIDHGVRLHTGDRVMVVVWVRFAVDVSAPIYGLTIKTPDGITVYGSNSRDFPDGPVMQPARAGETVRVVFQIDMRIGAGDFLMSLGVAHDVGGGEIEPLDRRYDSILIHVNRQSRCYGLADFDMRVEIKGQA